MKKTITPIPSIFKGIGFLLAVVVLTTAGVYAVRAALTFTGTTIESDGPLSVVFEGATADDFELTLAATDPTADRTATIPNLSANDTFVLLAQTQTLTNKTLTAPKFADIDYLADTNGNELIVLDSVTNAVNELTVANASTNTNPTITASGSDTNIGITVTTKGTGNLQLTTGSLKVGDGTPGVSLNGEDAYIEGTLEVDGATRFDGTVTFGAGTKIAHASVTSGTHGVVFALTNTLAYTDTNNKTIGVIPANANILDIRFTTDTVFNAGNGSNGNNVIRCGNETATTTQYVNDAGAASSSSMSKTGDGSTMPLTALGDVGSSVTTAYCRFIPTGQAATQGQATIFIYFMVD